MKVKAKINNQNLEFNSLAHLRRVIEHNYPGLNYVVEFSDNSLMMFNKSDLKTHLSVGEKYTLYGTNNLNNAITTFEILGE